MKTANEIQLFRRDEDIKIGILNIIYHPLMKDQRGKLFSK